MNDQPNESMEDVFKKKEEPLGKDSQSAPDSTPRLPRSSDLRIVVVSTWAAALRRRDDEADIDVASAVASELWEDLQRFSIGVDQRGEPIPVVTGPVPVGALRRASLKRGVVLHAPEPNAERMKRDRPPARRAILVTDPFGAPLKTREGGQEVDVEVGSGAAHLSVAFSEFGEVTDEDRALVAMVALPAMGKAPHKIDECRRVLAYAVDVVARALGRVAVAQKEDSSSGPGWYFAVRDDGSPTKPTQATGRAVAAASVGAPAEKMRGPYPDRASAAAAAAALLAE